MTMRFPLHVPPEIAQRFVDDMRAYFDENMSPDAANLGRWRRGLGSVCLYDPVDRLVIDPCFAGGDPPHAAHQQVGRDGSRDDPSHALAIELDRLSLICGHRLDNQLGLGRNAQQFARDAEQQARQAEARVSRAEEVRGRSEATARQTAAHTGQVTTNGDLQEYKKSDLMELASTIGIEGRTKMAKGELITAIRAASHASRSRTGV